MIKLVEIILCRVDLGKKEESIRERERAGEKKLSVNIAGKWK